MYMLYMWYCVHIIHVVLHTCGIVLYALCSRYIMTCVFVVLYFVYVYVLCCTPGVGVCVVLYTRCRCVYCVVLYTMCGCMHVMYTMSMCMWLKKREVLGAYYGWNPIWCVCRKWQRIKVEAKDRLKDKYEYFISIFNYACDLWF